MVDPSFLLVVPVIAPFASGEDFVDVCFGPVADRPQRLAEREPQRRQFVLDPRRDLGVGAADDEAVTFERAQRLREDLRADPHRVANLGEAARAVLEEADDQRRPAIADPVEGDSAGASPRRRGCRRAGATAVRAPSRAHGGFAKIRRHGHSST